MLFDIFFLNCFFSLLIAAGDGETGDDGGVILNVRVS